MRLALLALLLTLPALPQAMAADPVCDRDILCVSVLNVPGSRHVEADVLGAPTMEAGTYNEYRFAGYALRLRAEDVELGVEHGSYNRTRDETHVWLLAPSNTVLRYDGDDGSRPAPDHSWCATAVNVRRCSPLAP